MLIRALNPGVIPSSVTNITVIQGFSQRWALSRGNSPLFTVIHRCAPFSARSQLLKPRHRAA